MDIFTDYDRHIGKFQIKDRDLVSSNELAEFLKKIFSGLFILKSEYLPWMGVYEYTALELEPCKYLADVHRFRFDAADPGAEAPYYLWSCNEDGLFTWEQIR